MVHGTEKGLQIHVCIGGKSELKRLATLYRDDRDVIYRFNVTRVLLSRDKITRCVNVS